MQFDDNVRAGNASGDVSKTRSAAGPSQANRELAARATLLVVEDDPASARMVAAHLTSAGYRVNVAHSAAGAQAEAAGRLPDLVLCDICLPDLDGIQLTHWFRTTYPNANLPVVLITGSDDSKILARGLEAGADDFLAKPVNSLELRTRVRSLLRTKVLADELLAQEQSAISFAGLDNASHQTPQEAASSRKDAPVVVIVEDSLQDCRLMQTYIASLSCTTHVASSHEAGLALVRKHAPDLIILDLLLPDASGYELITAIKGDPNYTQIPILVVSALSEVEDRVKALELGADDFVVKGFERIEFGARVARLLRLKHSLDQISTRCNQAMRLAVTDSLTGLNTHGFLRASLEQQLSCAQRFGQPLSLVFCDLDHFKQVNDRHGHAVGDSVLRSVAHALRTEIRSADTLVRYGGEEFVIVLPRMPRERAQLVADRMRETVADLAIPIAGKRSVQVTMSLGVAAFPSDATDSESLLQRADEAMYLAKRGGRNCVVACGAKPNVRNSGASILIVDDDDQNLRLLSAYLASEDYHISYAHNGVEAIDAVHNQKPDLLIMDALMPVLSGFDACRRLKQDPKTQLLPVILVTAMNAREDRLRGIEVGADGFLTKPIDKTELTTRIRALLRQKRGTDVLEDSETVIFALAQAVEGRDPLLRDHVERVAFYSVSLGKACGLSARELDALRRAGIVHDIGKIGIPDAVLLKAGKLTPEERAIVERHPEIGYKLLLPLRTFGDALPAVQLHHERLNGSGYPFGLRGSEIPLSAQIVAIADVFDALSAPRCYRQAMNPPEVLEILNEEVRRGLHDPELMELFIAKVMASAWSNREQVTV